MVAKPPMSRPRLHLLSEVLWRYQAVKVLFVVLVAIWSALTFVGFVWVLPERDADRGMIAAFWEMSDVPAVAEMEREYRVWHRDAFGEESPRFAAAAALADEDPARLLQETRFRRWYNDSRETPLSGVVRLVWATDDNPARRQQIQLFRRWHLQKYGEPIDVITDPGSRDTREGAQVTKPVIQSIGGAGADLLETYGPKQLEAMVRSGIALEVTEEAQARGFEYQRCFDAGWSSFVYADRQYGFPANVGYTVLFYNKAMFEAAGVNAPAGGWTIDAMRAAAKRLTVDSPDIPGGRRWGIVGMHPWPMALSDGGQFFTEDGTECIYNSPQTVGAFQAYLDLMYTDHVMPSPADTASMAAAGGFTGGTSNGLFFAARLCAMTIGGRWEYATYAQTNFQRVIEPALRRFAETGNTPQRERIERLIAALNRDILTALSDADSALIESVLTDEERSRLLRIGVAHVPTSDGRIKYTDVGARVAMVNRKSKHIEESLRFLEFLSSQAYNDRINGAFDSICGVIEFCTDEDGISGPPRPLPGLEDFDSSVFVRAMDGAESQQLSPFIGPERLGYLAGRVMDQLMNGRIGAAEAARLIEDQVNAQMQANIARDPDLQALWNELRGNAN